MAFIYDYGLFAVKSITLVLVIALGVIAIVSAIARHKTRRGELDITDLSADYQQNKVHLTEALLNKEQRKEYAKQQKKELKAKKKNAPDTNKPRLFLIDFKGGMDAKEVSSLREEITAVLTMAKSEDEVLVRVESGGGVVHGYGLGASQLQRIRDRGLFFDCGHRQSSCQWRLYDGVCSTKNYRSPLCHCRFYRRCRADAEF